MAILKDILYRVSITSTAGDMETEVTNIAFDSRQVKKGDVFVAVKGAEYDGHVFVEKAIKRGAVAVVVETTPPSFVNQVTYVIVKNSARALGIIAANYYGNPSDNLKLVGVTGTNGKTTVATLLYKLYTKLGYKAGLLSTIENRIDQEVLPATHTTPDPLQINKLLVSMVASKCSHCFMEVSSHAAAQERITGLNFSVGVFTNLSHDHLDYHKTFSHYIQAKKKFFDDLPARAFALTNGDDKRGDVMTQNTRATKKTFSMNKVADFKAKLIASTFEGLELDIDNRSVWFKLIGDFNAYNLLAVYAVAILLGENSEDTLRVLSSLSGIPGRIEPVMPNSKFIAIIDYSHTPDALKNVLEAISKFKVQKSRIISVVGCGGNRDAKKRPLMASIACKHSDKVIFTSDNPRHENPMDIIRDMQSGISAGEKKNTVVLVNREEAIKTACMMAEEKDIVLVSGKGHEAYQDIKGKKYPFNDREVVKRMLKIFSV